MKNDSHSSFTEYFGMLNVCSRSQFPPIFSQRRDTPVAVAAILDPEIQAKQDLRTEDPKREVHRNE